MLTISAEKDERNPEKFQDEFISLHRMIAYLFSELHCQLKLLAKSKNSNGYYWHKFIENHGKLSFDIKKAKHLFDLLKVAFAEYQQHLHCSFL